MAATNRCVCSGACTGPAPGKIVHTRATASLNGAHRASQRASGRRRTPSATGVSHERFVLHPQPTHRRRPDLHLLQPAQAGRALRPLAPALLDEDPAGEPAPPRGRRPDRGPRAHRGGGQVESAGRTGHRDRLHAGAGGAAGLHRGAVRGRPGGDARCGHPAGRPRRADQPADSLGTGDRPLGAGGCVRPRRRAGPQWPHRVRAQPRALRFPALGPEGVRELQGGATEHRHRAPGEPGEPGPGGDGARRGRHPLGVPGHRVRHRLAHHHDQRHRRARLGRGRHRGRGRHARPALVDADSAGGRLQAQRAPARRRHRHRPGADRHPDAARAGRGRQVRRVLRRWPAAPAAGRPRHHRQHGAGVRGHLRHLPDRCRVAELPAPVRAQRRADRAGRSLCQGPGPVACAGQPACALQRHAGTGHGHGAAVAGRPQAPAGPGAAAGRAPELRRCAGRAHCQPRPAQRRSRRVHQRGRRRGGGQRAAGQGPCRHRDRRPQGAAEGRRGGDRRHHVVHQHLQPGGDDRRRPAGAQRRRARPDPPALGQDLARAGLAGGHRLPGKGRRTEGTGEAGLLRGRLRLHHLHRQLRPAAHRGQRRHRRRRPGGRLGVVGQPQLRGPRASRGQGQLPGLAAAGGGLRHRRHGQHRPDPRTAGHGPRRQRRLPARHLAQQQGNRRRHRRHRRPGDVQAELRRRVQGRQPLGADRVA